MYMSRVLGIDYGRARIGLAISDEEGRIAMPLTTLPAQKPLVAFEQVRRIIGEKGISLIVVGLPLSFAMSETEETARARLFGEALRNKFSIAVDFENEVLSSRVFEPKSKKAGRAKRRTLAPRDDKIGMDALSAAEILQRYLDRKAGPGMKESPNDV